MSLHDSVFESRDQRLGTHKGKTHSSGHPLAPIKAGFSTGKGSSSMSTPAFERAERKAKKRGERQDAKRDAEKEASPVPARRPIFKTGKTDREKAKDQAKAWFGGDKVGMARTKKLAKWVDYTNLSRTRRERDATTHAAANRKPLTSEQGEKTLKQRKQLDKAAEVESVDITRTVLALESCEIRTLPSPPSRQGEPREIEYGPEVFAKLAKLAEAKFSGRPEDRAAWRAHIKNGIDLGNRADREGGPLWPNRHKIGNEGRVTKLLQVKDAPVKFPSKMRVGEIASKLRRSKLGESLDLARSPLSFTPKA